MPKKLYIVHCIDTEGPLYEGLEANFERLNNIFGISLEPTQENLDLLRNEELDIPNKKAVANMLATKRTTFNENWDQISNMLDYFNSQKFNEEYVDSYSKAWKFNWFCLDHVGFTGQNPRRRDAGDHKVYDFYKNFFRNNPNHDVQWHYHPLPLSGHFNASGTTYLNSSNISEILCKKIIDRCWFPSSYRPGFHTERPDSHWFLEQWIPFDYGNQSMEVIDDSQPDLANGRFGNWQGAPNDWSLYHPHHDDYRKVGNCRRLIARCLNMESRVRCMTLPEVHKAFQRANNGEETILSFTNHDFRNMIPEIKKTYSMIQQSATKFPEVNFEFSNSIEAIRKVMKLDTQSPKLIYEFIKDKSKASATLLVKSEGKVFGPQPFLAIKTIDNKYIWENFDFNKSNEWSYTFDANNSEIDSIDSIGVASNSTSGVTQVINIDFSTGKGSEKLYNS